MTTSGCGRRIRRTRRSAHAAACVTQTQLAFEAQPFGRGAGVDDHAVGVDFGFLVVAHPHLVHGAAEVHLGHPTVAHVGVKPLGLVLQVLHHLRAVDAGGVAGEVVHLGGFGQLTAGLLALYKTGFMSARAA